MKSFIASDWCAKIAFQIYMGENSQNLKPSVIKHGSSKGLARILKYIMHIKERLLKQEKSLLNCIPF